MQRKTITIDNTDFLSLVQFITESAGVSHNDSIGEIMDYLEENPHDEIHIIGRTND
jgi:hypothetical protein